MIRFNGYPLLDKDDHAFNISGASLTVMTGPSLPFLIHYNSIPSHEERATDVESIGDDGCRCRCVIP